MKSLKKRDNGGKPKHRFRPEKGQMALSAKHIWKNVIVQGDGTYAWFLLGDQRWQFLSPADRATILSNTAMRWSELVGHRLRIRGLSHPIPHSAWARGLDNASPDRLPDVEGAESWGDYLVAGQQQIIQARLEDPATYVGVRITTRKLSERDLFRVLDRDLVGLPTSLAVFRQKLESITEVMARSGFNATPVSTRGMGWLMHASVGVGAPVSENSLAATGNEGWSEHDMTAFSAPVRAYAKPLSGTVEFHTSRDATVLTHHAAFLSVSRFNPRDTDSPAHAPWMAFSQRLPFPVEWSATFEVVRGADLEAATSFVRVRAESIFKHYREDHDETPPIETESAIAEARQAEHEVTNGTADVATRLIGPIRVAVFGPTSDQALARARDLISAYAANEQRIELTHSPSGQYALYREFIPGEEGAVNAWNVRVLPARFMATAVPNASTRLGDGEGPYLAQVVGGSRRAVNYDPQWGPRNNKSGLCLLVGKQGTGKTTTAGVILEPSTRRGHRCIANDPTGQMRLLADLPHLRGKVRHTDLSSAALAGALNPFRLIPVPQRRHYPNEKAHQSAVKEAHADRRELFIDAATMLLPNQMPGYVAAIEDAVRSVPGDYGQNPWQVVSALDDMGEIGKQVASFLRTAADLKGGILIFPENHADQDHYDDVEDAVLNIITSPGIIAPQPGSDRSSWTRNERMAVPVLHLQAAYAARAMYADMEPKSIFSDELGVTGSFFRNFVIRGSRESRRRNTWFGMATQNPGGFLDITDEIETLIGSAFVGEVEGDNATANALKLLGVPRGHGYEHVLGTLTSGEFLMRDYEKRVDRIRVDIGYRPQVAAALDTTPVRHVRTDDEVTMPFEGARA